jgi:hypothetical protein
LIDCCYTMPLDSEAGFIHRSICAFLDPSLAS